MNIQSILLLAIIAAAVIAATVWHVRRSRRSGGCSSCALRSTCPLKRG